MALLQHSNLAKRKKGWNDILKELRAATYLNMTKRSFCTESFRPNSQITSNKKFVSVYSLYQNLPTNRNVPVPRLRLIKSAVMTVGFLVSSFLRSTSPHSSFLARVSFGFYFLLSPRHFLFFSVLSSLLCCTVLYTALLDNPFRHHILLRLSWKRESSDKFLWNDILKSIEVCQQSNLCMITPVRCLFERSIDRRLSNNRSHFSCTSNTFSERMDKMNQIKR